MDLNIFRLFRCSHENQKPDSRRASSLLGVAFEEMRTTLLSGKCVSGSISQLDVGVAQGSHIYRSPKHSSGRLALELRSCSIDFCLFMLDQRQREVYLGEYRESNETLGR